MYRLLAIVIAAWSITAAALADEQRPRLFYRPTDDVVSEIRGGQFSRLRETHLIQYRPELEWEARWSGGRYSTSGMFLETGSVSARDLYSAIQISLNAPVEGRLGLRFDERNFRDQRFDSTFRRLEGSGYIFERFALVIAGWPEPRKEYSTLGGGFHIGAPGDDAYARILVLDDAWIHESKRRDVLRFKNQPLRYLADAYLHYGKWRYWAWINVGRTHEFSDEILRAPQLHADGQAGQSYAKVGATWQSKSWHAGLQLQGAAERLVRFSHGAHPVFTDFGSERRWGQGYGYIERYKGNWSAKALAGAAWHSERFAFEDGDGLYRMRALLAGVEGGYRQAAHTIRFGYIGNLYAMERASTSRLLGRNRESGYADKVHLRWIFAFNARLQTEALASHELVGGNFGGFAAKLLFML